MHLVESTAKKCAFLAEVAKATSAPVEIHCMRIEELSKSATSLKPDIVTARALAPLPDLLKLAAPWLGQGARGLFLKGRDAAKEIESAKKRFDFTCQLHPSMTADDSFVLEVGDGIRQEHRPDPGRAGGMTPSARDPGEHRRPCKQDGRRDTSLHETPPFSFGRPAEVI